MLAISFFFFVKLLLLHISTAQAYILQKNILKRQCYEIFNLYFFTNRTHVGPW